jgi:hypothetical protein
MVEIREYVSKFERRTDGDVPPEYPVSPEYPDGDGLPEYEPPPDYLDAGVPPERRFVAYADGTPQLMIEFFASDFHIYGPRALRIDEFLGNLRLATQEGILRNAVRLMAPEFPRRSTSVFSHASMICARTDGETVESSLDARLREALRPGAPDLESSFALIERWIPITTSYCSITVPTLGVTHWADIDGTPNARSGFGFASSPWEPWWTSDGLPKWTWSREESLAQLIMGLTTLSLIREDILAIAAFTIEQWRYRYV